MLAFKYYCYVHIAEYSVLGKKYARKNACEMIFNVSGMQTSIYQLYCISLLLLIMCSLVDLVVSVHYHYDKRILHIGVH